MEREVFGVRRDDVVALLAGYGFGYVPAGLVNELWRVHVIMCEGMPRGYADDRLSDVVARAGMAGRDARARWGSAAMWNRERGWFDGSRV